MNINCVICSDLFASSDSIFTTPCGHIFHHVCLVQWMERKKDCPQCRQKCTDRSIFRVYFNNISNLDAGESSENLIENIDNLTLQLREKDVAIKDIRAKNEKLEEELDKRNKKIKKLETAASTNNQIIATMRHEIDLLSSNKASFKILEKENAELKSKLDLMQVIESVMVASQKEVDDILKQNLCSKDLSVMCGTLRRELNNNECRKQELRKHIQTLRNDLRAEQEENKKLLEKISLYESENHTLLNRVRRLEAKRELSNVDVDDVNVLGESPEISKKPRLALSCNQDTPSPLSNEEFRKRIKNIQESDSPYLRVKSSSVALGSVLKKPGLIRPPSQNNFALSSDTKKLSIFKNPRLTSEELQSAKTKPKENVIYNGIGGTSKLLQSELKQLTWPTLPQKSDKVKLSAKKKLSPTALLK